MANLRCTVRIIALIGLLVLGFGVTGCAQTRMAGWGFVAAGSGLALYSGVNIGVATSKAGGKVDGEILGAPLGVSAGIALVGAIMVAVSPSPGADKEEPEPAYKMPNSNVPNNWAVQASKKQKKPKKKPVAPKSKEVRITCQFKNSDKSQTCFSDQGHTCTGIESCKVNVMLFSGSVLKWKSTCSGTSPSVKRGKKNLVTFDCAPSVEKPKTTEKETSKAIKAPSK